MRLPVSIRIHRFQPANVFQFVPFFVSCKPFFLLVRELHKYSSHRYSMKVCTANVIKTARVRFLFASSCLWETNRERTASTLSSLRTAHLDKIVRLKTCEKTLFSKSAKLPTRVRIATDTPVRKKKYEKCALRKWKMNVM